jgi:hypothetical protein
LLGEFTGRRYAFNARLAWQDEHGYRGDNQYDAERPQEHAVQIQSAAAEPLFYPFSKVERSDGR